MLAADKKRIAELQTALSKNYNSKLGVLNTKQFTNSISSLSQLAATFDRAGVAGQAAFGNLATKMSTIQIATKEVSSSWEKLQTTMANTARWGITSAIFQGITSSVMDAVSYVKELDESLTQITMVSGESRDNMKDFAAYANKAAASLGSSTTDYTNAVKVFVQEGFSLNESKEQATQATILGNVSEQDTSTTADQITAYRNAFGLSIEDMNSSLDKLANTANSTAADVGELMTAAQKAASTAAAVGASEDSFLASIATIQSVTRESAENIGNGLKSIYTRFADVSMGETTDDDVNLGQYAQALKSAGVNITDGSGNLKSMDTILSELQEVWATLDNTKKVAVGEKVAGRYQYNRFATLMNNQEYYDKAYAATQNADGAMNQMQSDYMEGITGKTQKMMTNIETLFTQIYNSGVVEKLVDGVGSLAQLFSDLASSMEDLFGNIDSSIPVVTTISTLFLKLGGSSLASSIADSITNFKKQKAAKDELTYQQQNAKNIMTEKGVNVFSATTDSRYVQAGRNYAQKAQYADIMTEEQIANVNAELEAEVNLINEAKRAEEELANAAKKLQSVGTGTTIGSAMMDKMKDAETFENKLNNINEEIIGINSELENGDLTLEEQIEKNERLEELYKNQGKAQKSLNRAYRDAIDAGVAAATSGNSPKGVEAADTTKTANKHADKALRGIRSSTKRGADVSTNARNTARTAINQISKSLSDDTAEADKLLAALDKTGRGLEGTLEDLDKMKERLRDSTELTKEETEALQRRMTAIKEASNTVIEEGTLTSGQVRTKAKDAGKVAQHQQASENAQEVHSRAAALTSDEDSKALKLKDNINSVATVFTDLSTAIMGVEMTATGVTTMFATLTDDSATMEEKVSALTTGLINLAMGLGMSLNGFSSMAESLPKVIDIFNTAIDAETNAADTTATEAHETATNADTASITSNTEARVANTASTAAHETATNADTASITSNTEARVANTTTEGLEGVAEGATVAGQAVGSFSAKVKTLGANLISFLKKAGPVFAAIGGIVLIVKSVKYILEKIENLNNASSKAADAAQSTVAQLSSSITNLNNEIDDLKDRWDNLEESKSTLDGLTKGTTEWRDAVREVNQQVLELIETYPELASSVKNVDGVLTIDETAYNDLIEKKSEQITTYTNGLAAAQTAKTKASNKANLQDVVSNNINNDPLSHAGTVVTGAALGGIGGGAAAGAAVGLAGGTVVLPVVGTTVGAGVGAGIGAAIGAIGGTVAGLLQVAEDMAVDNVSITNQIDEELQDLASKGDVTDDDIKSMLSKIDGLNLTEDQTNNAVQSLRSIAQDYLGASNGTDATSITGLDGQSYQYTQEIVSGVGIDKLREQQNNKGRNYDDIKAGTDNGQKNAILGDNADIVKSLLAAELNKSSSDSISGWSLDEKGDVKVQVIGESDDVSSGYNVDSLINAVENTLGSQGLQSSIKKSNQYIATLFETYADNETGAIGSVNEGNINAATNTKLITQAKNGVYDNYFEGIQEIDTNGNGDATYGEGMAQRFKQFIEDESIDEYIRNKVKENINYKEENGNVFLDASAAQSFINSLEAMTTKFNSLADEMDKVIDAYEGLTDYIDSDYLKNNTDIDMTNEDAAKQTIADIVGSNLENNEVYQKTAKEYEELAKLSGTVSTTDSYDSTSMQGHKMSAAYVKKDENGNIIDRISKKDYETMSDDDRSNYDLGSSFDAVSVAIDKVKDKLANYKKVAVEAQEAQYRLDATISDMSEDFDDVKDVLQNTNKEMKNSTKYVNALTKANDYLQGMLDDDTATLSKLSEATGKSTNEISELMSKAQNGDQSSYNKLHQYNNEAKQQEVKNEAGDNTNSETTSSNDTIQKAHQIETANGIKVDILADSETGLISVNNAIDMMQQTADQMNINEEVDCDTSSALEALKQLYNSGMLTAEQLETIGESMNGSFDLEYVENETGTIEPSTRDTQIKAALPDIEYQGGGESFDVLTASSDGNAIKMNPTSTSGHVGSLVGYTRQSEPIGSITESTDSESGKNKQLASLTYKKGQDNPRVTTSKANAAKSSSGSGSSGGSSKKVSKASKQNTASKGTPRKQIKKLKTDNVANKTSKILDKISKQNDKLYGKNQINNLKNLIKYQLKYVDTLNKQYKANAKILKGMKSGFKRHKYKDNDGNTAISYWTTSGAKNTNNGDKTIKGTKYKMKNKIKFNADGSINEASYEKARMELYNKVESARKAANKSNLSEKESKRRQNKYSRLEEEYEELTSAYSSYNSKLEENEEILESMSEEIDEVRETQETLIDTYKELNEMMDTAQDNFISIANALAQISSEDYGTIWSDIMSDLIEATSEAERYSEKEKRRRSYDGADGTNFTATKLEQSIQNMGDLYSDLYDYYNTKINGKTISQWEQDKTAYETAYNNGGNYTYTDANGKQKTLKGIDQSALEKFLVAYKKAENQASKKGMMMVNETTLNEYISDSYSTLAETVTNMKDAAESLKDSGNSLAEEIVSTWDDLSSNLSTISSKLDTLNDIAAIIEGSENYNTQIDLMDQQIDIAKANGEVLQHKLDSVTKLAETYKDLYGENSEQYINYASQQYEIQSDIYNNVSDILSYVQQQMELRFKQSAADILGELGIDSSSWMDMEWENNDSYNDGWYDEYEKSYQIQTLKNSYQNLLDDASSLSIQQKITEQMNQQIAYLQEKTNLSEYDVEYAEKQLDILKAQIALEDAQNNKNKMKLRRDASGNYSYVYTADENEVLDKQQELLDAQNEAYELAKERLEDASKNIKEYVAQAGEDLATIWETYSGEEAQKRSAEYLEQLQEYIKKTANNINDANNGLSESTIKLNKTLTECFSNNTLETLANKIKQSTISLSDFGFVFKDEEKYVSTLTGLGEKIDDLIDVFEQEVAQVGKDYETNINTSSSGIDTSGSTESSQLSTISSTISNRVKDCDDKLKTVNDALLQSNKLLETLAKTMVIKLTDNKGNIKYMSTTLAAQQGITDFSGKTSYTIDGTKYTASKMSLADFSEASENYANKEGTTTNKKSEESVNKSSGNNDDTSSTKGNNGWTADGKLTKADAGKGYVAFKKGTEVYSNAKKLTTKAGKKKETLNNGNGLRWNLYGYNVNRPNGKEWKLQSMKNTKRFVYTSASNIKNKALKKYSKYDTGGYTGNWTDSGAGLDSKNGKLAILHQKELVLNAKDTENMLKIVEAERDLMQKSSATTPTFDLSSVLKTMNNDTIEQRVQIDAQFPNAENTNEIKQALLSLADNAYIYANRNIK